MSSSPFSLTLADRAMLKAVRAWIEEPDPQFWSRFSPSWRVALRSAWEEQFRRLDPRQAEKRLRADHASEGRLDRNRIHKSWFLRALRDEAESVRRVVIARAEEPLRSALRIGLAIPEEALVPDRNADAASVAFASEFWTERLVGGSPAGDDDPAVMHAFSGLRVPSLLRLIRTCGLIKTLLANDDADDLGVWDSEKTRRDLLDFERDTQNENRARNDLAKIRSEPHPCLAGLGLLTVGRLLAAADPYRVRWALQHLPYGLAKVVRNRIEATENPCREWESLVLQSAWIRLEAEGRIDRLREFSP